MMFVVVILVSVSCVSYGQDRFVNSMGMAFVYIAPGTFTMGSPENERWRKQDEQAHQVRIAQGFYMQVTEVTQGQWQTVMGSNPAKFVDCGADCPVENVSWLDAQDFIDRLNGMDKNNQYRLPTEAEWEYACRAGTKTSYFWGDEADCTRANYGNSGLTRECQDVGPGRPVKVASYQKNPWGLYDMHGNVWEWCSDSYAPYPGVAGAEKPVDATRRIVRGGAYFDPAESCRSANRCWDPADYRIMDIGFRLVRLPVQ